MTSKSKIFAPPTGLHQEVDAEKSSEDHILKERFMSYQKGWRDGAAARIQNSKFDGPSVRIDLSVAYGRGYQQGRNDSLLAMAKEAERIGYDPRMSILRGS